MNEMQVLNIQGVPCYEKDGTAYIHLETAARGLGFTKTETKNGTEYTSVRWERVFGFLSEIGFDHKWAKDSYIPENIFYRLAMKAKNLAAEAFQAKIADEVIPAIRRHGAYLTPAAIEQVLEDPDTIIKLATALKEERTRRKELEAENEAQRQAIADFQPLKHYIDTILASTGTMTITQIAADYDMSAKALNKILHEEGIQHSVNDQWILYRKHMGNGYTKSETIRITHSDGRPGTKMHTRWTQKGRLLIHEILTRRGILAVMDKRTA